MPKQTSYLSDYRASEDGLDFGVFKPALLNILQNAETPLTVGVFGTWGSGKTSLLDMLMKDIQAKKLASMRTVWFTAWKYEQHDALWRAFMLRVIDSLYPRKEDGTRYTPAGLTDPHQKEGALHLERLERSVYETVNWQDEGKWSMDVGALAKQGVRLPIWLAFHLAGLGEAAKDLGLNPQLAEVLERQVREHHLNQLSSMEQFASEFEKAVRLILGDEGRLIVFVDDLDRCLPEKAVEVLEAIKLFLDVPGTVFLLGMDREVIRRGIETHYAALLGGAADRDEIPINGDVYLQKMIQIPFNLPPLDANARVSFIEKLEESLPADFRLDDITRQVFAHGLYPNPRQVKRALNVFYLLKQVAAEQETRGLIPPDVLAWPLLAKTVLIQSQWPELYKLWRQYPTLIQTLEEEYTRQPVSEDELLRGQDFAMSSRAPSSEAASPPVMSLRALPSEATPLPAMSSRAPSSDAAISRRAVERPVATGLIAPFINERLKYALLADLLRYPDEPGQGRQRARFSGLTRTQVQIYVGLVGAIQQTSAENAPLQSLSSDWLRELESGDPARMREILSATNELENQSDGPRHTALRSHLLAVAQTAERSPAARIAAADMADEMGYQPEDLHTFVPIQPKNPAQLLIARYPVTNIQFARFLESKDFADPSLWTNFPKFASPEKDCEKIGDWGEAGLTWLKQNRDIQPKILPDYWTDARFGASRKCAPVVGVSWYEANAYCKWLWRHWDTLAEGQHGLQKPAEIRLPTELEWLSAAGGELDGRFAWGKLPAENEIVRFANTSESGLERTTPVWMYPQGESPLKVLDLSGNAWEWQANYYNKDKGYPALRGGSWGYDRVNARVSGRRSNYPDLRDRSIGFRVLVLRALPS